MEKLNAVIGLITILIVLSFMIPMVNTLLPFISADSGGTTAFMVSSMILIIIAGGIYMFIKQSMGDGEHANLQRN